MTRVILLISQFMFMSDRFSFLQEEQKEAVRSERLYSKAKECCNKGGLFCKGRQRIESCLNTRGDYNSLTRMLRTNYGAAVE